MSDSTPISPRDLSWQQAQAGQAAQTVAQAAGADPADQFAAQIFLDHSTQVHRDHPLVTQFAALLGKTASEIDAIFAKAQAFDNAS